MLASNQDINQQVRITFPWARNLALLFAAAGYVIAVLLFSVVFSRAGSGVVHMLCPVTLAVFFDVTWKGLLLAIAPINALTYATGGLLIGLVVDVFTLIIRRR